MLTTSFKWTGEKKTVSIKTSVAARAQKLGILKWNAWLDSEGLFVTHIACSDSVIEYCMSCWQMPRYWLWMETAASRDRRLLPSVYSHLIFINAAGLGQSTWQSLWHWLECCSGTEVKSPQSNSPRTCAPAHETIKNSHDDELWETISGFLLKNQCPHIQQQSPTRLSTVPASD